MIKEAEILEKRSKKNVKNIVRNLTKAIPCSRQDSSAGLWRKIKLGYGGREEGKNVLQATSPDSSVKTAWRRQEQGGLACLTQRTCRGGSQNTERRAV